MKILSIHAENFASYKALDFEFDSQGLTLISGPTGSGKSTLCDLIPWALFGITAKGGKADEVLSWNGGVTRVAISIELGNFQRLYVTRQRGPNDLYFDLGAGIERGKDLQDTQKLIDELLGMNADLYLAGAYYHEFSQTASFFTTTAKNRREITENLVDLSLPTNLQEKIKIEVKDTKDKLVKSEATIQQMNYKINTTQKLLTYTKDLADGWSLTTSDKITQLEEKSAAFEMTKRHKINTLETEMANIGDTYKDTYYGDTIAMTPIPKVKPCSKCGTTSSKELDAYKDWLQGIKQQQFENSRKRRDKVNLRKRMQEHLDSVNTYAEQANELKQQTNPQIPAVLKLEADVAALIKELDSENEVLTLYKDKSLNLDLLSDAVQALRSELVRATVESLETETNQYLYNYFDGEIKLNLSITDTEKLDITMYKDSNEAAFTQLSKGQRCMLKLCFGLAVINTVQQHHTVDFRQLYFDEALDGLDDNNKMKAVKMLEAVALQRDSVYIVEHSGSVKALVDQKIEVELVNGRSQLQT